MTNAVLVDGLHLAQQMVQSFSLASPSWSPAIILPPVCRDRVSVTPMQPSLWGCPIPGTPTGQGVPPATFSEAPPAVLRPALAPAQGCGAVGERMEEDVGMSEDGALLLWGQVRYGGLAWGRGSSGKTLQWPSST